MNPIVFGRTLRIRRRRAGSVDDTTDAIRAVACIRFVRRRGFLEKSHELRFLDDYRVELLLAVALVPAVGLRDKMLAVAEDDIDLLPSAFWELGTN